MGRQTSRQQERLAVGARQVAARFDDGLHLAGRGSSRELDPGFSAPFGNLVQNREEHVGCGRVEPTLPHRFEDVRVLEEMPLAREQAVRGRGRQPQSLLRIVHQAGEAGVSPQTEPVEREQHATQVELEPPPGQQQLREKTLALVGTLGESFLQLG